MFNNNNSNSNDKISLFTFRWFSSMNWHKLRVGQLEAPTARLIRKASQTSVTLTWKAEPFLCLEKVKQKKDRRQDCVEQILLVFAVAKERFDT